MDYTDASVGDRVTIVSGVDGSKNGTEGVLSYIDVSDPSLPYKVVDEYDRLITWAYEVRRGTGLADASLKVGDYVEVTKDRDWTSEDVGRRGRITKIDDGDSLPYRVKLDDGDDIWFMDVRKIDVPTPSPFAAHVEEAKRLLAGTNPTAADVIRLAEILAQQ